MTAPRWPLPLGHVFGPSRLTIQHHDGRSRTDSQHLRMWQSRICGHWRRPWMQPNGVFDGATQRAVVEVQEAAGLPRTGLLGPREWVAAWTHTPDPPPKRQPTTRAKRRRRTRAELAESRAYWLRQSQWQVQPGSDPDAPAWYPGKPFGPHMRGDHVRMVQNVFGLKPTGYMSARLSERVAGLQRANGLPVSGVVDARTARLIEQKRQEQEKECPGQ